MHELLDTLFNPIFWQGAAAAGLLALVAFVLVLTLCGRANDEVPLATDRRRGDRQAWPARAAQVQIDRQRGPRPELRGGPR